MQKPISTGTHMSSAGVVTDPKVECGGGRTQASIQLGPDLPSPTPRGWGEEPGPGRGFCPQPPSYLLSHEEPTLDETVQHLLTVAVGRLAGLRGKRGTHVTSGQLGRAAQRRSPTRPAATRLRQAGPAVQEGRRRTKWAAGEVSPAAAAGPVAASATAAGSGSTAPSGSAARCPAAPRGPQAAPCLPAALAQHRLGEEEADMRRHTMPLTSARSSHHKPWGLTTHSLAQEGGQQLSAQACQGREAWARARNHQQVPLLDAQQGHMWPQQAQRVPQQAPQLP